MDSANQGFAVHNFSTSNYIATDPLPRDQGQSTHLHEPNWIVSRADPITGRKIDDPTGLPTLVDGNLTIYFENEATRREFIDMPVDHPFHLVDNPVDEGYDEG